MSKPKLALIPSGYKSGKVYSILPNDATGDFDFTRQSIGTRVRKDGLIEEAKTSGSITNVLLYSEDYSQVNWAKTSVTVTTNQFLAPDGTNSADKLDFSSSTSARMAQVINAPAGNYTFSVYLRSVSGSGDFRIRLQSGGGINLTVSLTEQWQRFDLEYYHSGGASLIPYIGYYIDASYIQEVYSWGAMVSEGALSDYIKTEGTTETKTVETFTDVPRLDWYNSNCPSLLLEPQRSNFFTYSENASQWTSIRGTTTNNNIVAPNGELVGNLYEKTEDANEGYVYRNLSVSSVGTYSASLFFKYNNSQYAHFLLFDGSSNGARAWFDIQNGVVGTTTTFGTTFTVSDLSIEDYGNGWYKCSAKYVVTGTDTTWQFRVSPSGGNGITNSDSGAKVYFFGAQIEQGSYPTSYIKTEASTVTRLKDDCHLLNHTLFTDYPFTVYAKAKIEDVGNTIFSIYGGASNKYLAFLLSSSTQVAVYRRDATNNDSDFYNFTYSVGDTIKVAVAFINDTTYKLYINGTEIADVTSGLSIPFDHDDILLGQFRISADTGARNSIDDFRVYDYTLTDAELTELTK